MYEEACKATPSEIIAYARRQLALANTDEWREWWAANIEIAESKLAHKPEWRPLWWQTRLLAGENWWVDDAV